jgi:putative endonuclease
MDRSRQNKGQAGEDTAVDFLTGNGLKILERNFRCPPGEIDIIAKHGQTIVFVEVRTRHTKGFGTPEESITALKRSRLIRAAQWYLKQHKLYNTSARFDVVTIRWNSDNLNSPVNPVRNPVNPVKNAVNPVNPVKNPEINWIVNAFEAYS